MHLFLELTTILFFGICVAHAVILRGARGRRLMLMMMGLGFVRETFVVLTRYLYGYAELNLELGVTPLIAAVIWGYSIYGAICFAELVTKQDLELVIQEGARRSVRWWLAIAGFMTCLVGFYEPFLELVGMARWEDGTRKLYGAPWIACVGYPTLALSFSWLWIEIERRWTGTARRLMEGTMILVLGPLHGWGLQNLKDILGW